MTDKPKGALGLPGEIDKAAKSAAPSGRPMRRGESKQEAKEDAKESTTPSDKPEKPLELKKPTSEVPPKEDSKPIVPPPADENANKPDQADANPSVPAKDKPAGEQAADATPEKKAEEPEKSAKATELKSLTANDYRIESSFDAKKLVDDQQGTGRLSLTLLKSEDGKPSLVGRILWPNGEVTALTGEPQSTDKKDSDKKDADTKSDDKQQGDNKKDGGAADQKKDTDQKSDFVCEVNYPLGPLVSPTRQRN